MVLAVGSSAKITPDKPQIAAMASGVFFLCHIEKTLSTELTSTVIHRPDSRLKSDFRQRFQHRRDTGVLIKQRERTINLC
jgi:hypothetical protein